MTPASRRAARAPGELRRELQLVRRLLLGTLVGTLAAIPFLGLLLLVRAGYGPLSALDGAVADGLNGWARQRPGAVGLLELISDVTSPWTFRVLVVVVAVVLWRYGRRRLATWAVVTMSIGGALGGLLKSCLSALLRWTRVYRHFRPSPMVQMADGAPRRERRRRCSRRRGEMPLWEALSTAVDDAQAAGGDIHLLDCRPITRRSEADKHD